MPTATTAILKKLESLKSEFGSGAGAHKLKLLSILQKRRLRRAADLLRLHEVLCFMRAYPDSSEMLTLVERMLDGYAERSDLRQQREALLNSGIAGTPTMYAFHPATALWLARRFGERLTVCWADFENQDKLEQILPELALYSESPGLDEYSFDPRDWIERLKAPHETDAVFILRRLEQLQLSPFLRERLLEDFNLPLELSPGSDTPARSHERYPASAIAFQTTPLQRSRPSGKRPDSRRELTIHAVKPGAGQALIELARSAMASRGRELEAFVYADRNDVRLVDCGNGLQFAYLGVTPERRFLLETLYGFLMLKNGVVIGYGSNLGLFGSSEIAFTIFDTYRGSEAHSLYEQVLAIARQLFRADTTAVDPYQLGEDNDDAIRSGAWWFYYKLGYRPREPELKRLARRELARIRARPSYRSTANTLQKLASAYVFCDFKKPRQDVIGVVNFGNVGLRITQYLAERFGHDRRRASRTCAKDAAALLGVRSFRSFTSGERLAWQRWSPLVLVLPNIARWPQADKRALVEIMRAKGGRRESDYLLRFDQHRRLRRSILKLAEVS